MNYTPINSDKTTKSVSGSAFSEIEKLREKVGVSQVPDNLKEKINANIDRIESVLKYGGNAVQVDNLAHYIEWVIQLPWGITTDDALDLDRAKKLLDKNHYGLTDVKRRVLEYISLLMLKKKKFGETNTHAPVLLFVGLAGTGKTTFAISVAETLGRKLIRIPFGGLSSSLDIRGVSKLNSEAEPGLLMRSLCQVKSSNPVILLDEIDRIDDAARGSVMGVLLELLDPEQNSHFVDHFIDFPFDLSRALFIATSNNTQNISSAVLDRLEIVQMPSYSDVEKIVIAKQFILPRLLAGIGLDTKIVKIEDLVWQHLARESGYDPGIRSIERKVESIVRSIAYRIVSKNEKTFTVTAQNVREYIK